MRTLYFDCFAGASGDMVVGALLDAGADRGQLTRAIEGLGLEGVTVEVHDVTRTSIRATKFEVHSVPSNVRRGLDDIHEILARADLDDRVRDLALQCFTSLANAEAHVHGIDVNEVHFHEVGALDAIADIVAACAAYASLAPEQTIVSPIALGRTWVDSSHGPLPTPAPAVLELLKGIDVVGRWDHESVTPTGAALLRTFADRSGSLPEMTIEATGYGAGTRNTEHPNVLRVIVGETDDLLREEEQVQLIEANIDDMSPELLPYVIETLISAGAQDAWTTPITMKKGRHAVLLSVLATSEDVDRLSDIVFRETTTFGLRRSTVMKEALPRTWIEVAVYGMTVRVKVARRGGQVVSASPEYEDAVAAARATGQPLKEIYTVAASAAREVLEQEHSPTQK